MISSCRDDGIPDGAGYAIGFRVAGAVPEPSTVTVLLTGAVSLLAYAWRRRRV
jgi:hypothetical protein